MAREPEDLTHRILRDIQATQAEHGRHLAEIKADLRRQVVRIDELFESSVTAFGLAGHANVRHEAVRKELDEPRDRVEQLEKRT